MFKYIFMAVAVIVGLIACNGEVLSVPETDMLHCADGELCLRTGLYHVDGGNDAKD